MCFYSPPFLEMVGNFVALFQQSLFADVVSQSAFALSSSCILSTALVPRKIFYWHWLKSIEYMYALRAIQSSIVAPVVSANDEKPLTP